MYGYGSTFKIFKKDLHKFFKLDINHLSIYSLILEEHTKLYQESDSLYDECLEQKIRKCFLKKLKTKKYIHYEYSNFAKLGHQSKHNLNYWQNNHYYGFGLGAHGYIKNIRYQNTRSITEYNKGQYHLEEKKLTLKEKEGNEFILGLRKIEGLNKKIFKRRIFKRNKKQYLYSSKIF